MARLGRMLLLVGGATTMAVAVSAGYVYFLAERFERKSLPAPVAARPFDYAAQKARDDAQDRKYDTLFTSGRRWTRLPEAYDANFDASGHVWWNTLGQYTVDDFKRSIERAVARHSPSIHGGRVLLVDSRGRHWCRVEGERGTLLCYDGKQWLAPRAAAGASVLPSGPASPSVPTPTAAAGASSLATSAAPYALPADDHRQLAPRPVFLDAALDDGAGNVYFVAGASQLGPAALHRFAADDTWSVTPFPATVSDDPQMARQCDGRVVVYAPPALPQGNGSSMLMSMVLEKVMPQAAGSGPRNTFVWDGARLSLYQPVKRPADRYKVNQAVPLPDGSILTVYTGTDRVSIGWPAGAADRVRAKADGLIRQLDDPDARVRETARVALTRLGPSAKAAVDAALLDPKNGPERQDALTDVRDQLAAAAKTDIAADEPLFGGRYRLERLVQVSRPLDGSVRLFAEKAEDHQTGARLGPSLIRVDPSGAWQVDPLPATPAFARLPDQMDSALEDTGGRLWIGRRGEQLLDLKTFALTDALPPACDFGWPSHADSTGRVYFSGDALYVCDTNVVPAEPELPVRRMDAIDLRHAPGERGGWCMADGGIVRIDPTGVRRVLPTPAGMIVRQVQPLAGEAAIAEVSDAGGDRQVADQYPYLITATGLLRPHGSGNLAPNRGIVHGWERPLLQYAPRVWTPLTDRTDLGQAASDRGRGLWYECSVHQGGDDSFIQTSQSLTNLEYFDGTDWTAVWPLFPAPADPDLPPAADALPPEPGTGCQTLGTVEDGHVLLVNQNAKLYAVEYEAGRLRRRDVPDADTLLRGIDYHWRLPGYWAAATPQAAYAGPAGPATGLAAYRDGRVVARPWVGQPLSTDSAGRLWGADGPRLNVLVNDTVLTASVDDLDASARVVDALDGRLWLLHAAGLTELKITAAAATPLAIAAMTPAHAATVTPTALTVGRTWAWGAPLNQFDQAFIDTTGGLWLGAPGAQVARVTLPRP